MPSRVVAQVAHIRKHAEQSTSSAMALCGQPAFWRVSMCVFWTSVQSAVFPMVVQPTDPVWVTV